MLFLYLNRVLLFFCLIFLGNSYYSSEGLFAHEVHDHHYDLDIHGEQYVVNGLDTMYFCMQAATVIWVFAIAASVGSFLNVVIYRMPLQMNLSKPKSHCPQCKNAISPWDNIPILGWLKLGGKCRNCQCRISPRYPLVEAAVGTIVLAIFFGELLRGCSNLPFHSYTHHTHSIMSQIIWEMRYDLIVISLVHAYLMVMLVVFALISMDGLEVPRKLMQGSLLFVLCMGLILPDIYPVAFHVPFDYEPHLLQLSQLDNPWPHDYQEDFHDPHWDVIGESVINLTLGILTAYLLSTIWKIREQLNWQLPKLTGIESMLILTGGYLGWQAVLCIFLLYQGFRLLIETWGLFRSQLPVWFTHEIGLVSLTLAFILNWKTFSNLSPF